MKPFITKDNLSFKNLGISLFIMFFMFLTISDAILLMAKEDKVKSKGTAFSTRVQNFRLKVAAKAPKLLEDDCDDDDNEPPVITSTPVTTATEDSLYTYDVDATDPDDDDVLTYYLAISPAGMTIDSVTGLINWTPTNEQVGDNDVVVEVSDICGAKDAQAFTITVADVNDPPVITSIPVTTATEDTLYSYDVEAMDPDIGSVLTYHLAISPDGMTIDSVTGLINWTPTNEQVGDNDVVVQVDDGRGGSDDQFFTITVINVNDPPVITSTPITTAKEDELYTYDVEADDPDVGDALTYSLTVSPDGMSIDEATGLIQWTPTKEQVGDNDVTVQVSDVSGATDSQSFTITVVGVENNPPVITSTPITTGTVGVLYEYDVEAVDPDDDPLTFSLTLFPEGMTIDEITGLITWTPSEEQTGSQDVTVEVSDGRGGSDTQSFIIEVAEAINNPPVITSEPVTTSIVGVLYEYDVEAVDPDDDPLTFSLTLFPEGMTIDGVTGLIIWTPSEEQTGSQDVTVEVSDGQGGSDTQSFTIEVLEPTIRPVAISPQVAGDEFTIDIEVENAANLFGIAFVLNYDTTYIDALSAEKGDFLGDDVIFLEPVIDDDMGTASIGITRKRPADGVDGGGVVAQIRVKSVLTTPDGTSLNFTITDISATDPEGKSLSFTPEELTVEIISPCVWPGDTDNSGRVDEVDVLPIGLHWGLTGPERPDASLEWECQPAELWTPEEATYADANGDGVVDQADVLPIGVNWGRVHDVSDVASNFWLQPIKGVQPSIIKPIAVQRRFKEQFAVGIKVKHTRDLFGIAFAIKYTHPSEISPLSVEAGDFLGSDVVFYYNVDKSKGTIRIGISRKHPKMGVNGSGVVAKITFQGSFNLPVVRAKIEAVTATDSDGRIIPFVSSQGLGDGNNSARLAPSSQTPAVSKLSQNFPNPFNPETWIPFQLTESADVTISIYDSSGKLIRVMNLGEKQAGFYTSRETSAYWDGRNSNGEIVSSGVYFYAIRAGKFFAQRKMIVVR
ncbi:MAG: putative Ig domain-containing protein [Candidatus Poribacteria bacterium]